MTDREWKKIVDDAFASDDEHVFSGHYRLQKQAMMKGIIMDKRKNNNKKSRAAGIVIAAAALAAAVPAAAFAASRISANVEKTAPYQNTLTIEAPAGEDTGITGAADEIMAVELGYVPEGYTVDENDFKYSNEQGGGFTPTLYHFSNGLKMELPYSESSETIDRDDRTIIINYRVSYAPDAENAQRNFGREIWVHFKDTAFAEEIFITDDMPYDEAIALADGLKLVPADEPRWCEYIPSEDDGVIYDPIPEDYNTAELDSTDIYQIGETAISDRSWLHSGDNTFSKDKYSISVDSVKVQDTLDGIEPDFQSWYEDIGDILDENGELQMNTRTWFVPGDGVDSIDEDIYTEVRSAHFLIVDMTYECLSSDEHTMLGIRPELYAEKDGTLYDVSRMPSEHGICYRDSLADFPTALSNAPFAYQWLESNVEPGGKNTFFDFGEGSKVKVRLAYVVDDECLDSLYLRMDTTGRGLREEAANGIPVAYIGSSD